ncbi:hypothetical protein BAU14_07475 [Enterococcus sp. CU9D]|nr:hypothetical protein BAU14_07475 [Enterococcus sp. CU9D]
MKKDTIKRMADLKSALRKENLKKQLSIFDETLGYAAIDFRIDHQQKGERSISWVTLIAAPSVKMKTVGEFLERLEVYPDQTVVATVGLEGGYSPVHIAVDGLGKETWLVLCDEIAYHNFFSPPEHSEQGVDLDLRGAVKEYLKIQLETSENPTETRLASWLEQQEDSELLIGVLKEERSLSELVQFCIQKASASKGKQSAMMVSDEVVFQWVREYYTTDIEVKNSSSVKGTMQTTPTPQVIETERKEEEQQISLF